MCIASGRARAFVRVCVLMLFACTFSTSIFAYPTTWEFKGTVTISDGALAGVIPQGSPIRVLVSFDTDEAPTVTLASTNGDPGLRYNYWEPGSLAFAIYGGSCNPCTPSPVQAKNSIIVRDSYSNAGAGSPYAPLDGYSFSLDADPENDNYSFQVILRGPSTDFNPEIVDIAQGANPLPVEPNPRSIDMALAFFAMSSPVNGLDFLQAEFHSVGIPTYGTYAFLSGRHCLYPDGWSADYLGDDCLTFGGSRNGVSDTGGGTGQGDFSRTLTHYYPTPDPGDAPELVDELGTLFGAIAFGGPGGLPVLRGSSFPTALARTNSNLLAYQQYAFNGGQDTPLQLVVDLGYSIQSAPSPTLYPPENPKAGQEIQVGLSPGGATFSTVLSIVDGAAVPAAAVAAANFGSLGCGNESQLLLPNGDPWPAGSILGNAVFQSPDNQTGPQSVQLSMSACDGENVSGEPVVLSPGDTFFLTASMQLPARGKLARDGGVDAAENGMVDAANTIRVIPDPAAPPAVLQQLLGGLAPVCDDCDFAPEIAMDVKPGDAANVIVIKSKGNIDVALLGAETFDVNDVKVNTLLLGRLSPVDKKGNAKCTIVDVNFDGQPDLLCQFENKASNWTTGQTLATLSAELWNGETILATDSIVVR